MVYASGWFKSIVIQIIPTSIWLGKRSWLSYDLETTYHRLWGSKRGIVDKQEALKILGEIKENINICCAITMEPDEVLELLDKIEVYIKEND